MIPPWFESPSAGPGLDEPGVSVGFTVSIAASGQGGGYSVRFIVGLAALSACLCACSTTYITRGERAAVPDVLGQGEVIAINGISGADTQAESLLHLGTGVTNGEFEHAISRVLAKRDLLAENGGATPYRLTASIRYHDHVSLTDGSAQLAVDYSLYASATGELIYSDQVCTSTTRERSGYEAVSGIILYGPVGAFRDTMYEVSQKAAAENIRYFLDNLNRAALSAANGQPSAPDHRCDDGRSPFKFVVPPAYPPITDTIIPGKTPFTDGYVPPAYDPKRFFVIPGA